jgi:branched-chain amino acid transport system substrate-binding protein
MTIGVLVPRSGLFPSISFDLVEGIRAGLADRGLSDAVLSVENIGYANDDTVISAMCEKLLMNGADVVAGYVNPSTAEALNPLFKAAGKIFIALDAGYHLPSGFDSLSNVISISLQGAFCCRMLASVAREHGASSVVCATSFYDAGYRSGLAYTTGIHDNGGSVLFHHITHLKKSEFTLEPLSHFLDAQPADAILASFCGDMAEDFFSHARQKELYNKAPMYCSPFMAEETLLDSLEYIGKDMYTVVPWSRELLNNENTAFKEAMSKRNRGANVMSLLGWEAALAVNEIKDRSQKECAGIELDSPRGKIRCGTSVRISEAPVYSGKITQGNGGYSRLVPREQDKTAIGQVREQWYNTITQASKVQMDTWHNAYLCIE